MNEKKLVEHVKKECACDVVHSEDLEIKPFGNSAHIIVPKRFLKQFKPEVVIGLWKRKQK